MTDFGNAIQGAISGTVTSVVNRSSSFVQGPRVFSAPGSVLIEHRSIYYALGPTDGAVHLWAFACGDRLYLAVTIQES